MSKLLMMEPTYKADEVLEMIETLDLDGLCLLGQVIMYDKPLYNMIDIRAINMFFHDQLGRLTSRGQLPSPNYGIPSWLMQARRP